MGLFLRSVIHYGYTEPICRGKEGYAMATKSVLKNVMITSVQAENFVQALEKAELAEVRDVDISKPVKQLSREDIKNIFCK